eukprot:scaffold247724_cov13-Tisochrysis_lutea.AAC.1
MFEAHKAQAQQQALDQQQQASQEKSSTSTKTGPHKPRAVPEHVCVSLIRRYCQPCQYNLNDEGVKSLRKND